MKTSLARLASLTTLFCTIAALASAQDGQPCRLMRMASLDMSLGWAGDISVPINISGRNFLFRVDTGDTVSVISSGAASILGNNVLNSVDHLEFMGKIDLDRYILAKNMQVDQLGGEEFKFMIAPQRLLGPSDGLIGADFLANFDLDIDFAANKLNLFDPNHCPGKVVYWTRDAYADMPIELNNGGHITVAVTLDGKAINADVDTGADRSSLGYETAVHLFNLEGNSKLQKLNMSVNGGPRHTIYRYPFDSLSFGAISVSHPEIDILPDQAWGVGIAPMIIGRNVLRALHLYVAYKEHKLYATPAEAH
ncbi:MAG TPA: aspartyl protease family protein [Rhizomicrobium sp.]|jgi:predicted aspartyl protease